MKPDVRKEAHAILSELEKSSHNTLDQILDTARTVDSGLSHRDKAFLQALLFGVLRSRNRLDWIIRHFSKTPFRKISPGVLNILRLGVYQILYMDRVPDSAAVNTSVELAKAMSAPWTIKFVNGLLRNVARNPACVKFPDVSKNPTRSLSVSQSLPEWLINRWVTRFGLKQCIQLCEAVNTIPPLSLRTNTLQTTRAALLNTLADAAKTVTRTPHTPEGLLLFGLRSSIHEIKAFADGQFQVQDEAAQLIAHILAPRPGHRVLDACAGFGGKTGHIAQLMANKGAIIALDAVDKKLISLKNEMSRLGISIVKTMRHDLKSRPEMAFTGTFDRILLDAPCSGLGVLRRNPDTRWNRTEENLNNYSERQQQYLNNLAPLVKPGGILVYAVCSTEPEENETVIHQFLSQNRLFEQTGIKADAVNNLAAFVDVDNCVRTFPHRHNMDGFFAACFRRRQ